MARYHLKYRSVITGTYLFPCVVSGKGLSISTAQIRLRESLKSVLFSICGDVDFCSIRSICILQTSGRHHVLHGANNKSVVNFF